ncbi:hypothetical protein BROUX41_000403 [Berkeleyomyces rouxiae]|uniref:uncharacterized protein n=1 Tax=Berkeleyomyces rouxiae TaxID=2035830 RepID=UPI003B78385E
MCTHHPHASPAPEPEAQPNPGPAADPPRPAASSLPAATGPLYDAHCHPTDNMHHASCIASMRISRLIAMSTRIQDQPLVAALAQSSPKVVPAFGWHPWFAHLLYDDSPTTNVVGAPPHRPDLKTAHYAAVLDMHTPLSPADAAFIARLPAPHSLSTFLADTRVRLLAHPTALVGEIGLDRAFRLPEHPAPFAAPPPAPAPAATPGTRAGRRLSPYRVSLAHQRSVLAMQVALAAELNRPISVHGVQAHGVLYEVLADTWRGHEREVANRKRRRLLARGMSAEEAESSADEGDDDGPRAKGAVTPAAKPFPPRICLHSFSGPKDVAQQYLHPKIPCAVYFSFSSAVNLLGGSLTKAKSGSARQKLEAVLSVVPDDRILAESDLDTPGDRMDAVLADIYATICEIKGWEPEAGVAQIARNFEAFVTS